MLADSGGKDKISGKVSFEPGMKWLVSIREVRLRYIQTAVSAEVGNRLSILPVIQANSAWPSLRG